MQINGSQRTFLPALLLLMLSTQRRACLLSMVTVTVTVTVTGMVQLARKLLQPRMVMAMAMVMGQL